MKNPRLIDMTGQHFGHLTVIKQIGNSPRGAAIWLCLCDCGKECHVIGNDLRNGKSLRCRNDALKIFHAAKITHGASKTATYRVWKSMRARCHNPKDSSFKNYGARGIRVCARWNHFDNFLADMGERPVKYTIDRINNDDNYYPQNCRWASYKEQAANKRNVPCNFQGEAWCRVAEKNGITRAAYRTRVFDGWPIGQAATWPMFKKRPRL